MEHCCPSLLVYENDLRLRQKPRKYGLRWDLCLYTSPHDTASTYITLLSKEAWTQTPCEVHSQDCVQYLLLLRSIFNVNWTEGAGTIRRDLLPYGMIFYKLFQGHVSFLLTDPVSWSLQPQQFNITTHNSPFSCPFFFIDTFKSFQILFQNVLEGICDRPPENKDTSRCREVQQDGEKHVIRMFWGFCRAPRLQCG